MRRHRGRSWALGTVAGLALALVAAGCGGGSSGSNSSSSTSSSGKAQAGGTLRIAIGSEPPSLDPGLATDTTSAFVVQNINTPIVYLGPAPDLKPQPGLAQSWTVNGSTVTLHLRKNVKWQNGQPVTAHDVVWSWLRTISPQLAADYAYQFYGIKGAQAYNSCQPSASNQQCNTLRSKVGITAPDDYTVKIQLTSPQPWFMQQLSHTSFIPVYKPSVQKWGNHWTEPGHIVTDGPFELTQWQHNATLQLVKNPGWYDASRVKLAKVVMQIITQGSTAEQTFAAGSVDVNMTGWPPSDTQHIKSQPTYQQFPALGTYYYGFNVKQIPDVNQRKAMALAIDRQTIVQHITQEGQVPATQYTPKGIPGSSTIDGSAFLRPTADLQLAKQYMTKVTNPVKNVTLIFNNAPGHKEIATAVQAQWQQLGLNVTLKQQDWPQFLQFLGPPPNSSVDTFRMGWIADFPDDINFLDVFRCGGGNNYTNWCNKQYDSYLDQATKTQSQTKRYQLYAKAEQLLTGQNGDMPIAPIYWYTSVFQVAQNVHGWNINPMYEVDLTKVSIS
jgi:oligopeptide transport system substrate-binding protein